MIVNVTDADYNQHAKDFTGPLMIVFGTVDDLGSMVLGPVLLAVDRQLGSRLTIVTADTAACPKAAAAWGVGDHLPVILILRSGILERVLHGVRSERRLLADIDEALQPR
ncbi:hypothetical protein L0U85_09340 [Glycomyces sp. L485]|uniref:hypothetical protein n=1 Tax=Glycomyces sp. L485 TaxID=2909235 RepID=UPI001F4AA398|nr:hypothetical protein [Glycomyces sp. L485]MCH7231053.1 hypothetical protein [Glycomyces sp. L485]